MRTTLNINDDLMKAAAKYTGLTVKTAIVHEGLKALIERGASLELARAGGSDPTGSAGPRRRSTLPRRRR